MGQMKGEILTFEDRPESNERVWRHTGCGRWHAPLDDCPPPTQRECDCCAKLLPAFPYVEFAMHSQYARSGPNARTLARAWHQMLMEEHPDWMAWEECSEDYRRAHERRFLRLIDAGVVQ